MKFLICLFLIFGVVETVFSQEYSIVLDAGHGGKDPGTEKRCAKCADEKDIALDVVLLIGKLISENYSNLEVVYTRKDDTFVSLDERVKLANGINADLFLSIHCNANPNTSIEGFQIHIHDHSYLKSKYFGESLENALIKKTQKASRGIFNFKDRESHLYVLQYTKMPSVLAEIGFLSHAEEEKFLNSYKGKAQIAQALLEGIDDYCKKNQIKLKKHPKTCYKIQITASDKPIPLTHLDFKKLEMEVEENKLKSANFPYKYTVGKAQKAEELDELVQKVKQKGFSDAFVAVFEESE